MMIIFVPIEASGFIVLVFRISDLMSDPYLVLCPQAEPCSYLAQLPPQFSSRELYQNAAVAWFQHC